MSDANKNRNGLLTVTMSGESHKPHILSRKYIHQLMARISKSGKGQERLDPFSCIDCKYKNIKDAPHSTHSQVSADLGSLNMRYGRQDYEYFDNEDRIPDEFLGNSEFANSPNSGANTDGGCRKFCVNGLQGKTGGKRNQYRRLAGPGKKKAGGSAGGLVCSVAVAS